MVKSYMFFYVEKTKNLDGTYIVHCALCIVPNAHNSRKKNSVYFQGPLQGFPGRLYIQ